MFYAPQLLGKKGPLGKIWLAAHWEDKVTKAQIFETNISQSVDRIMEPHVRLALRTISHLLLGIVRIYARKTGYLLTDCNEIFIKLKMAFRPDLVDLPEESIEATIKAVTYQPEFNDFDVMIPELSEMDIMQQFQINQARAEAITLKEVFPISSGTEETVDPANTFGDEEDIPDFMREFIATIGQRSDEHTNGSISTFNSQNLMPSTSNEADKTDDIKLFEEMGTPNEISSLNTSYICDDITKKASDEEEEEDDRDMDFGGPPSVPSSNNSQTNSPLASPISEINSIRSDGRTSTIGENDTKSNMNLLDKSSEDEGFISQQTLFTDQSSNSVASMPLTPKTLISTTPNSLMSLPSSPSNVSPSNSISNAISMNSTIGAKFSSHTISTAPQINVKTKRRRKLLIDQVRNISGEEMRNQLSDTSDVVMMLDMAPPNKRMMHFRATGILEKMFSLPTTEFRSNSFFERYQKHLITRPIEADSHNTAHSINIDNVTSPISVNSVQTPQHNPVSHLSPNVPLQVPIPSPSPVPIQIMQQQSTLSRAQTPISHVIPVPPSPMTPQPQQLSPSFQMQSITEPHMHAQHLQSQEIKTQPLISPMQMIPTHLQQIQLQNQINQKVQEQQQQQLQTPQFPTQILPNQIVSQIPQHQTPLMHQITSNNLLPGSQHQTSVIVSAVTSVPSPANTMNFNNISNDILQKTSTNNSILSPRSEALLGRKRKFSSDDDIVNTTINRFDDLLPSQNNVSKTNYSNDISINEIQYSNNNNIDLNGNTPSRQLENMGFTMNDIHNQNFLHNYNEPMSQATYYDSNMYELEDQEEMLEGETEKQYLERVENERALKLFGNVKKKLETCPSLQFSEMCHGLNRKQTAHNFYSLLVLKKARSVNMFQKQCYDEIYVTKGENFDDPLVLRN